MEIQTTKKRFGNILLSVDNFVALSIEELFTTPVSHSFGKSYLYAHYDNDDNNNNYLYISTLYTKTKYRGLKYASKLLNRAIYEAKKNKCVMCYSKRKSSFYNMLCIILIANINLRLESEVKKVPFLTALYSYVKFYKN